MLYDARYSTLPFGKPIFVFGALTSASDANYQLYLMSANFSRGITEDPCGAALLVPQREALAWISELMLLR